MVATIQITLAFLSFVGVNSYCMNGWTRFDSSCYLFVDLTRKTWVQADQYCVASDSHLVQVDTLKENNFLKEELKMLHPGAEDQFWTSGNDRATENSWVWGHTNDSILTKFWFPGEPNQNGGEEDCLAFYPRYNFAWNDEHCDRQMFFVCELE